ncbi:hypothetical protein K6119_02425 [Paracrocinitomix mangrovi]|uniref:hypothetical protein n=1 Tax=Paracrocinitomix mangrovi TaxID=2862509 RepID=UPI001EDA101D|nr:hypothetical protein [Paracrocinitomix mangrovi]UKN02376.1 hypothetical protein K6119_02425 [Paracrocinitomix mangrovi]
MNPFKSLGPSYQVISDKKDKTLEKDVFRLSGHVKMFSSLAPLENVLVGCTSSGLWVRTNAEGEFEIDLKATDSTVCFYLDNWSEIVIEDYDFKPQHHIVLDVFMSKVEKQVKRKPVIYLYSEYDLSASVKLDPLGEFTFTYPKYEFGWNVEVLKDGGIKHNDKIYPYLFWEGETDALTYNVHSNEVEGFIVQKDEVVSFLEDKLTVLGLNTIEQTDFITYWTPILQQKEYAFVQFVVDQEYQNQIGAIDINPAPHSGKRVFIKCSNIDSKELAVKVVPQELTGFTRNGFTLVEWGGAVLSPFKLMKDELAKNSSK